MENEVTVGALIVDRATLRGIIRQRIAEAKPLPMGRWEGHLCRIATPRGANILSAAIYRSCDFVLLFVWLGQWGFRLPLVPAIRYAGRGW
jgi:hypothetical protein